MKIGIISWLVVAMAMTACVRQEDLDTWKGQPVAALDSHPFFNTLPVQSKTLADGTEIRNYVNGGSMSRCSGAANGTIYGNTASVFGSESCVGTFAACNNQFYIKNGRVIEYIPVGSGGGRCMTDDRVRPRSAPN